MNRLSPTDVLRYLNRNLGAALNIIELNEDEMMRVVFQETIPTFSKYFPWHTKIEVDARSQVPGKRNQFFLSEDELLGLKVISIHKGWISQTAFYGYHSMTTMTDPVSTQLMQDVMSQTQTPITFLWEAPNKIQIYPYITNMGQSGFTVELNCQIPTHMKTIPMGYREWFLKLALLDVLISIYPIRHRFADSLNTPFGQISLFLEQVDGAKDERQTLLETFQENILKDSDSKKIWIG